MISRYLHHGPDHPPIRKWTINTKNPAGVRFSRLYPFSWYTINSNPLTHYLLLNHTPIRCASPPPEICLIAFLFCVLIATPPSDTFLRTITTGAVSYSGKRQPQRRWDQRSQQDSCKDERRGYTYQCEHCGIISIVHFGCNSRICSNGARSKVSASDASLSTIPFFWLPPFLFLILSRGYDLSGLLYAGHRFYRVDAHRPEPL